MDSGGAFAFVPQGTPLARSRGQDQLTQRCMQQGRGNGVRMVSTTRVGQVAPATLAGKQLSASERERYSRVFLDEASTAAEARSGSSFPFTPEELIERAKLVILQNVGVEDESILSDNFQFVAPVVGPIGKDTYVNAVKSFKLDEAFPDATTNTHDLRVDPWNPRRVWYVSVFKGANTGKFAGNYEPTGKTVETPPQVNSITFDNDGKVEKYTIGYVTDRTLGNTGGLGGVFGLFYALGNPLPMPEGRPWQKSWQYKVFEFLGGLATRVGNANK